MPNTINRRIHLTLPVLVFSMLVSASGAKTIYVDDDATGANNGSSWAEAYRYLQDALADANLFEKPIEIRVAQGMYKPDRGAAQTAGNREATFQLISGVTLKGGYAGLSQPDPNARDIELYKTILSGDLNGDDLEVADPCDLLGEPSRADNCYHVATGSGTDNSAVLDGFTINAGNADRDEWQGNSSGGGMANHSASPTVVNCTFTTNAAIRDGGGMYNYLSSDPKVTGCTFSGNYASHGGGMANVHSSPTLDDCAFSENCARWEGGGMFNSYNSPTLTNCTFAANSADSGAGISNFVEGSPTLKGCTFSRNAAEENGGGICTDSYANPTLDDCTFSWNSANQNGGGMYNHENSDSILTDCVFMENSSGNGGGGMWNSMSSPTLRACIFTGNSADFGGGMATGFESRPVLLNCTFSGNSAGWGGGMANSWDGILILTNCSFAGNHTDGGAGGLHNFRSRAAMANCILWENVAPQITGDAVVSYSDVQGGWAGEGNRDADPLFTNAGHWADANDPNIVVEPNHPNAVWVDGDYHLKSQAGRWDPASQSWAKDDVTSPCIDAGDANSPVGDEPEPNGGRINMGAYGGTKEASKSLVPETIVYIQWLGHSSVKLWAEDCIVYVDPQSLSISPHDATLVLVTHSHGDHYSASDIARVANAQTQFIAPPDVVALYGKGQAIAPGQTIESYCARLISVPAYNTNKTNHLKSRNWVGYVIELGGKRIYVAGDTDLIDEMKSLGDIDVAILPAGGTYTMTAAEAAQATQYIRPDLAIPYHWGRSVGTLADAQTFAQLARCAVKILAAGETIGSDNWPVYSPLSAHWKLDETAGNVANDSVDAYDGMLYGGPAWQSAGGKTAGALQLDGVDDYVATPFVSNPNKGPFSAYAWVKGGAAGRVIVSQTDVPGTGATWLGADPMQGRLMTALVPPAAGRLSPQPLVSAFVVTDSQWHHVGLVWDGSLRHLYADGAEVAKDTIALAALQSCEGGLYLGVGKGVEAGTFWMGLLDDVRIYNVAITPAELEHISR